MNKNSISESDIYRIATPLQECGFTLEGPVIVCKEGKFGMFPRATIRQDELDSIYNKHLPFRFELVLSSKHQDREMSVLNFVLIQVLIPPHHTRVSVQCLSQSGKPVKHMPKEWLYVEDSDKHQYMVVAIEGLHQMPYPRIEWNDNNMLRQGENTKKLYCTLTMKLFESPQKYIDFRDSHKENNR